MAAEETKISWDYNGECTERIGRQPPCTNFFSKLLFYLDFLKLRKPVFIGFQSVVLMAFE